MVPRELRILAAGVLVLLLVGVVQHLVRSWMLTGTGNVMAPVVEKARLDADGKAATSGSVRAAIREQGEVVLTKARATQVRGGARMTGAARWSLRLSPLLDLLRVLAVVLIVRSAIRLMCDPAAARTHQATAGVAACLVLWFVLLWNPVADRAVETEGSVTFWARQSMESVRPVPPR